MTKEERDAARMRALGAGEDRGRPGFRERKGKHKGIKIRSRTPELRSRRDQSPGGKKKRAKSMSRERQPRSKPKPTPKPRRPSPSPARAYIPAKDVHVDAFERERAVRARRAPSAGTIDKYAQQGAASGSRKAFEATYYGTGETEQEAAARRARPMYKERSPSAQRPPLAPAPAPKRNLAAMIQDVRRRSLSSSPVQPTPAPAARTPSPAARAPSPYHARSMTPDDPAVAAQIEAENKAILEKYGSGSVQMSERERRRRMPRSSVPTAVDTPVREPKVIQRTHPRDLRAMRSSVDPLQQVPAQAPRRQQQPPRKLSQMRSSVSPQTAQEAVPAPTRRGVSERTIQQRYDIKPAMQVDESDTKKRKRGDVPASQLDKSLGMHGMLPGKPAVKRPRPGKEAQVAREDAKLKRMTLTTEQAQGGAPQGVDPSQRQFVIKRRPSPGVGSTSTLHLKAGTSDVLRAGTPSDQLRKSQEARSLSREGYIGDKDPRVDFDARQRADMEAKRRKGVSFSPEVQEKEYSVEKPIGVEETSATKQLKPDRGFRRDVPSLKQKLQKRWQRTCSWRNRQRPRS